MRGRFYCRFLVQTLTTHIFWNRFIVHGTAATAATAAAIVPLERPAVLGGGVTATAHVHEPVYAEWFGGVRSIGLPSKRMREGMREGVREGRGGGGGGAVDWTRFHTYARR